MFLSFGRKGTPGRKPGTPIESPKTVSSSGASPAADVGSRSAVQTVAGPLLSSTRFNAVLDASTFANVSSPGFTSRVVNCASNGNSPYDNSATHQSKYSSVGLFPRVQLGGQSILPILSPRISQKVGRTPVRVRIAPPERRHSFCGGALDASGERSGIFKQLQSSTQSNLSKDSGSTPSKYGKNGPSDNNQESTRKRIFSESQDACQDDAKKRRRKAEIPIPNPNNDIYHYRHVRAPAIPSGPPQSVASSQGKRAREKGSPEEQKHQRRKTCNTNNAIFSSLSSSRNLLERLTAQKRKSVDTSRSSSPLTPVCGRHVKESKTVTDVKAVQCNLDGIPQQVKIAESASSPRATPVSSKGILKRGDANSRKSDGNSMGVPLNGSQITPTCDYTTKLFRKETSSNTPRTPVTKPQKQSFWVKAPEADELTCSLLNDDANLDRPERLKSLLACVSGKDKKLDDSKTAAPASVSMGMGKGCTQSAISSIALPSSTSPKLLSPSSAHTVTVSSTCTIMTSATVTSVNGVPSSESGSSPPPRPVTSLSTPSMSLGSNTSAPQGAGAIISPSGTNVATGLTEVSKSTALLSSSIPFASSSVDLSKQISSGSNESIKSPPIFSMKSPVSGTSQPALQGSVVTSTLQFGSSVTTSAVHISANTSSPASKPSFQFGAQTEKSSEKASVQLGSNSGASPVTSKPTLQFGSVEPSTNVSSEVSKPAFSFASSGGDSTLASKPTLQFGSSPTVTSGPSEAPKAAFSFGASGTGTPKAALQFGSGETATNGPTVTTKPAFSFGSSGGGSSLASKPTLQFGSGAPVANGLTEAPKAAFSFGASGKGTPKPALQFGSSGTATNVPAETSKSAFSFGSGGTATNGPAETSKPAFSFGSGGTATNGPAETSKPAFSFGSSGGGSSLASKPTLQFGSSTPVTSGPTEAPKAAFSFGANGNSSSGAPKPAFQFASNGPAINGSSGTPKPAFSFGSSGGNTTESSKAMLSFGSSNASSSNTNSSSGNGSSTFQFGQTGSNMSAMQSINGVTDASKSSFQFSSGLGNKTVESSKPAFQFSSSSTEKPSFGSQASGSVFGQSAPQQTKGAFSFGSSGSGLGSNSPGNFGSSSGPSAFGAPTTNTQSSLPSFGSLSDSKPNGFGSAPSFGSSDSTAFSFSSNTAPTFSVPNASGNSGAFAFGQKQDHGPQSFNFSASVTAVPNPSGQATQAPGLFSVGTGSSQRRTQTARRRR